MSSTLLRAGLWVVLIVIILYVLQQSFEEGPLAEYVTTPMLQKALALGILAAIAGLVTRMLEKGAKVVTKNRCVVCRTPVPPGAIYCRAHLRSVLHREEDREHTYTRRRKS
jgi:predicted nucleic acid-binding Zn ribbon protein